MQRLVRVELPIALPIIVAGVRIATVTTVGLVAVTTFIGLGGLGYLIINDRDQRRFFPTSIYVGIVLCVAARGDRRPRPRLDPTAVDALGPARRA